MSLTIWQLFVFGTNTVTGLGDPERYQGARGDACDLELIIWRERYRSSSRCWCSSAVDCSGSACHLFARAESF